MTPNQPISRRTVLRRTGALAGVGAVAASGITGSVVATDGVQDVDITLASTFEPGHILVEAAEMFAERMEEETDGAFSTDVVPGGAYGAEDEIADQVAGGVVEMHSGGGLPFSMFTPEYYFYDTPFVVEDLDHFERLWESEEFEPAFEQLIQDGNQRNLGTFIYRGLRQFTSNVPVQHPDDVQGMNLRLPELEPWVEIWSEIGADPTPVALDELYSALQTGVAEASEGDAEQIHSFNLFEVQDHLSLTEHMVQTGNIYINEEFYQGLDDETQNLVDEVADEVTAEASQQAEDREEDLIDDLEAEGMEVVDDVDRDAFFDAAEPAVDQLFEERWEGTWDEWLDV